jgi:hypothetical protein
MKKIVAFSLFFVIVSFSASAQNGLQNDIRNHKIEQRKLNNNQYFNHRSNPQLRREIQKHRMMEQRGTGNRNFNRGDGRKIRMEKMKHHRRMMMHRNNKHRRVI